MQIPRSNTSILRESDLKAPFLLSSLLIFRSVAGSIISEKTWCLYSVWRWHFIFIGIPVVQELPSYDHLSSTMKTLTVTHWGQDKMADILKTTFSNIYPSKKMLLSWWHHQMETFSALTSHQWIPLIKASDAELWCFLWSASEQNG